MHVYGPLTSHTITKKQILSHCLKALELVAVYRARDIYLIMNLLYSTQDKSVFLFFIDT